MEAFKRIGLKAAAARRRLESRLLSVDVFEAKWETPIFVCPVGGQQAFFHEGELATARAARAKTPQMILSSATSTALEEVSKALRRTALVSALHATRMERYGKIGEARRRRWMSGDRLDRRSAGRQEHTDSHALRAARYAQLHRMPRQRPRHPGAQSDVPRDSATRARIRLKQRGEYINRLKKLTRMKVLLKGLDSAEDARLAVEHGADGIIVSNHGGRASETLRGHHRLPP